MADNSLIVNIGTALTMASDDISSVHYPRMKVSLGADGAASDWTGNIPSGTITKLEGGTLGVLAAGTITKLEGGTLGVLANGTISNGTVSTVGIRHPDTFATVVSTGTTALGTIKAAVSGSAIYITDIVISAGSATTVVIASGGTSTPVIGSLQLNQYGGMVGNFITPLFTANGSALVYQQSVGCPLSITCAGYVD